ncbi:MAG: acyltransferase family protein [Bacteroidaceae bacterium]|nr:acyltransferase family protein [Bacteroidaceae bacterium]
MNSSSLFSKQYSNYWKGVAIVFVVLSHLVLRNEIWFEYRVLKMMFHDGRLGVNIFFFLSVYGLCFSYENSKNLISFYIKRIKRIYPMYLVFIVLYLSLFGSSEYILTAICHFFGLVVLSPFYGMMEEWYIPALTIVYIVFPLLYKVVEKISNLRHSTLCFCFLLFMCVYPGYYFSNLFLHPFLSGRLGAIFSGIIAFFLSRNMDSSKLMQYVTVLLFGGGVLDLISPHDCMFGHTIPLLVSVPALLKTTHFLPCNRFFSFCGEHSLEIYLAQHIGINTIYWQKLNNHYLLDFAIGMFITIVIAVFLGYIQKKFYHVTKLWNN